jgi:hypothetical protein
MYRGPLRIIIPFIGRSSADYERLKSKILGKKGIGGGGVILRS